ncbi:Protein transport protein SEC16A-like protein [Raphanus sativus]|nr:Protein transport protein SEC16A-like protein [Raphanus sativus]
MASSNPQLLLDDQTDDEDFFDRLVDDSYSPSGAQAASSSANELKFGDGSDSDDATKAFASLSLGDDGDGPLNEEAGDDVAIEPSSIPVEEAVHSDVINEGPISEPSSVPMEEADADKLGDDVVVRSEDKPLLSETVKESDGSVGSPVVKEVDWGSFCADSPVNDGRGFGSYSDFFTELEGSSSTGGKAEVDVVNAGNLVSNDTQNASFGFGSSAGLGQHQGEASQDSTSEQYVDNSQAWENSYPGWKYDANTGQWYQLDGHDVASVNSQESYSNSTSNWESGVASTDNSNVGYLRQSTTSAVAGTAESVSSWNQVSQVGNGYPEHMVFDAQYPGWYFDTIAQEWRSLDSYNQASQTSGTAQAQNGQGAMFHSNTESSMYNINDKSQAFKPQEFGIQSQQGSWDDSYYANNQQQQVTNTWPSENGGNSEASVTSVSFSQFGGNQQVNSLYSTESATEQFKPNANGAQGFIPQHMNVASLTQHGPLSFSNDFYNRQKSLDDTQQSYQSNQLFSPSVGRSPDGRPPHALDSNGSLQNSSFGSQGAKGNSISVLNLAEVTSGSAFFSSLGGNSSSYFRSLHQQCLPGPLVGGSVGSKELNKWLDESILHCESSDMDFSRGKLLKMLLSLLRISCQYYGKLRSPFGTDTTQKDTDSAEAAVAKLFAFAKKNGLQNGGYAPLSQCLQHLPPESQMQVTASEVQNLLASGRKMEALQCAQEGHLWGPALVIAAQLGDQFYTDTVKQMALRQLVPGSPLRTLCLLVAGQPAEVFSNGSTSGISFPGSVSASQHQTQFESCSMLDNWEDNLGIITANRTTDDELVITHLGDSMWKERSEIIAAHICYLIADKNFDPYSDSARLCLVGADHWKYPRTYASPEAIQRTELYEYSKTLGNSQYILLPFQPYKIIYAHMLAEVGKLSAAQKYCQAISKCLKTGRSTEVETWKQFVSSLEERIRIHQQGGYTVNSAPAKIYGKFLNFIDNTAHRVVGGMPPIAPQSRAGNLQANEYQHHQQQEATKLPYSQSANTMQSLMSHASMEPVRELGENARTMATHSRSVSEPDFGRTPVQDQPDSSKDKATDGAPQVKSTVNVTSSRFSRFGFGILKNTVGRVLPSRSSKEAKLGDENQFYYDEKLKRWVEKGVEPPAEEAALPPPPIVGTYRSNSLGYENNSDMQNEMSPPSGSLSSGSPTPSENSSGIPPISQGSNQFSARGRPRYVDLFNQGGGNSKKVFQSPPAKSAKPPIPAKANFFIPAAPASSSKDQVTEMEAAETRQEYSAAGEEVAAAPGAPPPSHSSFQSPTPSPMTMQRFPSLGNMKRSGSGTSLDGDFPSSGSRRTASWSGSMNSSFTSPVGPSKLKPSPLNSSSSSSLGEELQEVEL